MDFEALIEYNKYTLALSAGCFAYALEKFVPMPTDGGRMLVLALLTTFFLSTLIAVIIFAAATAAQHPNKESMRASITSLIEPLGIAHTALLIAGLIVLGGMLSVHGVAAPEPPQKRECCVVNE